MKNSKENIALSDLKKEARERIGSSADIRNKLTNQHINTLITHLIAAAIEQNPSCRYGQILRNLNVIKEIRDEEGVPTHWKNDCTTASVDVIKRIGSMEEIQKTLRAHFKRHSGLKKEKPKKEFQKLTRLHYNRMINQMLMAGVQSFPDWTFGNILRQLEITKEDLSERNLKARNWINDFNTESERIFYRVSQYGETVKRLKHES